MRLQIIAFVLGNIDHGADAQPPVRNASNRNKMFRDAGDDANGREPGRPGLG